MWRDSEIQMVKFAVGVAYLPRKNLVVVSALIIGNEVERRWTADAITFITIDVKVNPSLSNKFHPFIVRNINFSPSRRTSI